MGVVQCVGRLDSQPGDLMEVFAVYVAKTYKDSRQAQQYPYALKPLNEAFGLERAASFGPRKLIKLRSHMISKGWSRTHVNRQIGRVKHFFRWASKNEYVPADAYHKLLCVDGLRPGEEGVREDHDAESAARDAFVDAPAKLVADA